jgi:hypothetical protein
MSFFGTDGLRVMHFIHLDVIDENGLSGGFFLVIDERDRLTDVFHSRASFISW